MFIYIYIYIYKYIYNIYIFIHILIYYIYKYVYIKYIQKVGKLVLVWKFKSVNFIFGRLVNSGSSI